MLGDGATQARPVSSIQHVAPPAGHRHDFQLGADLLLALISRASSPSVRPWRSGIVAPPTKLSIARLQQRPFGDAAADRIRPVEHDDADAGRGAGDQALLHRPDERIDPRADVLQIDRPGNRARRASRRVGRRVSL